MPKLLSGAEIVFKALEDQKVEYIFGYPGGAVLPIYDELKNHKSIKHILARHEQGAGHSAEGYARSSGKPGVLLVTSGPGATNAVTALTDAYMDSIPLVCISGQVPTHLIGTDAFQECDTTGITRPCTKHNWLVKDVNDLSRILHLAFEVATTGRPGPVLVDIPKDIQFKKGKYKFFKNTLKKKLNGRATHKISNSELDKFIDLIKKSSKPIFYTGGGVINSGPEASKHLRELVSLTGFPITSTLQGLGAYPGDDPQFLGMLGMHGTYEANNAMHDCDLMINIGARFDDRITGKVDEFSPGSGPRAGYAELILPSNEPGSSIMPGKVNPTQTEAVTMVCVKVIGNHNGITMAGSHGHFELNVFKPLIAHNILQSIEIMSDSAKTFALYCVKGIKADKKRIKSLLDNSLMLVTALAPKIGYDQAANIAKLAHKNGTTLKEEVIKAGLLKEKDYDKIMDPMKMTKPK